MAQQSERVLQYVQEQRLPFLVLIDSSRETIKAYGVWHRVGLDAWNIARPALFLIARDGRIVQRFISTRQDQFPTHEEVLGWIDRREP